MRNFLITIALLSVASVAVFFFGVKPRLDASATANRQDTTLDDARDAVAEDDASVGVAVLDNDDANAPHADPQGDPQVDAVRVLPFDAGRYPATKPRGEILGGVSFLDLAGENFVIFTRDDKERDDHIYESTLYIHHVARKDGVVSTVRTYVERVANCDFDVVLTPYFGDWSVSDQDKDIYGEFSFAYRVGCISDVSPVGHKTFVTESGEKYVLRGLSAIAYPGEPTQGGTYTADVMPEAFRQMAKDIWTLTSHLPND